MYIEITPHKSNEYDCFVLPIEQYEEALQYAIEVLDQNFDELMGSMGSFDDSENNNELKVGVSIKLCKGEIPRGTEL